VQAVLIEPVTAQNVVIFGDGPIGLFAVGVAKAAGARSVTMVGVIETRLEIAKQMGADRVFNNREGEVDPVEAIMQATGGLGADVVIEMSGAPQAFRQAFDTVRKGGRVSLFGISSDPMTFDFNYTVILRQVRVFGVAGRHMWDTWFMMDGLLASGKLDPRPVITCELKLEDFDKGFEQMVSKECGKVILRPFA
jgi:threonine 3-dehydrogenase